MDATTKALAEKYGGITWDDALKGTSVFQGNPGGNVLALIQNLEDSGVKIVVDESGQHLDTVFDTTNKASVESFAANEIRVLTEEVERIQVSRRRSSLTAWDPIWRHGTQVPIRRSAGVEDHSFFGGGGGGKGGGGGLSGGFPVGGHGMFFLK